MSKPWRVAGLLLAVAVFVSTIVTGEGALRVDGLPIVVSALYGAVAAFIWVWLLEAVVVAIGWLGRRLFSTRRSSDRGD